MLVQLSRLKIEHITFFVVLFIYFVLLSPKLPLEFDIRQPLLKFFWIQNQNVTLELIHFVRVLRSLPSNLFGEVDIRAWYFVFRMWFVIVAVLWYALLFPFDMLFKKALELFTLSEFFFRLIFCSQVNVLSKFSADSI